MYPEANYSERNLARAFPRPQGYSAPDRIRTHFGVFDTSFYEFQDDISVGNSDKLQNAYLQARPITDKDDDDLHFTKPKTDPAAGLRKKIIEFY